MTEQEIKEMSENNRLQHKRLKIVYSWATELGWKFDTKMAFLNFYIPNTNFRYNPTYRYWIDSNDFYDKIFKIGETHYFDGEPLYSGIIESKEHLKQIMLKLEIPINEEV